MTAPRTNVTIKNDIKKFRAALSSIHITTRILPASWAGTCEKRINFLLVPRLTTAESDSHENAAAHQRYNFANYPCKTSHLLSPSSRNTQSHITEEEIFIFCMLRAPFIFMQAESIFDDVFFRSFSSPFASSHSPRKYYSRELEG